MPKSKVPKATARKKKIEPLVAIEGYMAKVAKAGLKRHSLFSLCVRASAAKCFEFNRAVPAFAKEKNAFFAMSTLRGICEDLIVLRFVSKLPARDREDLIRSLSNVELIARIKLQGAFFSAVRPQQPVLGLDDADSKLASSEAAARSIWNRHGWPRLDRGSLPQIRQIAEKQGLHQLAVLYDYLYRLTSAGVHFSVQSLLRSGWGEAPKEFVFSPKNFHRYFADFCSLYGSFLFCLYFEFFGATLRPGAKERELIDELRGQILFTRRWPEMVTFEEMNLREPSEKETLRMIVSALQAASRKRLISKGVDYKNRNSAESKRVASILKLLEKAGKPSPGDRPSSRRK